MSDRETPGRRDERWIVVGIAVAVFYVLSPGPVAWLEMNYGIPQWVNPILDVAYLPLEFLYDKIGFVRVAYDAYFGLLGLI